MCRWLLCLISIMTLLAPAPLQAQSNDQSADFADFEKYAADLMTLYNIPGMSIGIVQHGQTIYSKGFGVKNTQTNQSVDVNTLFEIGSITKSFTALAVLQLVSAGKLDLDTPIVKYVPSIRFSDPDATQQITMRMLLTHTSGLPPVDLPYAFGNFTRFQVIVDIRAIELEAPPGRLWLYSNQNYVLAGYVVEQITGQRWEDYLRKHVLDPLKMQTTDFSTYQLRQSGDFADPHALVAPDGMQPLHFYNLSSLGPATELNANVSDLIHYLNFQLGDGNYNGQRLLPTALFQQMHVPQADMPSPLSPLASHASYGFGWFVDDYRGATIVHHGGNTYGFTSDLMLVPAEGIGIVVLTNANYANDFVDAIRLRLLDTVLHRVQQPDVLNALTLKNDPAKINQYLAAARIFSADTALLQTLAGAYSGAIFVSLLSKQQGQTNQTVTLSTQTGLSFDLIVSSLTATDGIFLINGIPLNGSVADFKTDPQGTTTIYVNGAAIAQRVGKNAKVITYTDPGNNFIISVPTSLRLLPQSAQIVAVKSAYSTSSVFIGAIPSQGSDAEADAKRLFANAIYGFAVPTALTAQSALPIPSADGRQWIQYVYTLPDKQFVLMLVNQTQGITYGLAIRVTKAMLPTTRATFPNLLSLITINH